MAKTPAKRSHSKKKRRGQQPKKKKGGGVISGMRGGFKNVAGAVTGIEDERAKNNKKNAFVGTVVTIVLIALVAVFLMYR